MFILSKVIHEDNIRMPLFAQDFPECGFEVNPEDQEMEVGGFVRLRIVPSFNRKSREFTKKDRAAILAKYEEVGEVSGYKKAVATRDFLKFIGRE